MNSLPTFDIQENTLGGFDIYWIVYASEIDYVFHKSFDTKEQAEQYVEENSF